MKVVDFGIARALASITPDEQSEVVWGSPLYFSPEQAAGGAPSPASDVYSLGVVIYEMLTGRLPFEGDSPQALAQLHREAPPPAPRGINPAIPLSLEQIVLKVLSKEPSARYRTADQLGRVLLNFGERASSPPVPEITQPSARPPVAPPVQPLSTVPGSRSVPSGSPKTTQPPADSETNPLEIDWLTWLLALLAVIAVGGLIPFWLWVIYILFPPL
jgi:serine/threonine-protein kinase